MPSPAPANDTALPRGTTPSVVFPDFGIKASRSPAHQQADEMLAQNAAMNAVLADLTAAIDAFVSGGSHG